MPEQMLTYCQLDFSDKMSTNIQNSSQFLYQFRTSTFVSAVWISQYSFQILNKKMPCRLTMIKCHRLQSSKNWLVPLLPYVALYNFMKFCSWLFKPALHPDRQWEAHLCIICPVISLLFPTTKPIVHGTNTPTSVRVRKGYWDIYWQQITIRQSRWKHGIQGQPHLSSS